MARRRGELSAVFQAEQRRRGVRSGPAHPGRDSLIEYTRTVFTDYRTAPHHVSMAADLEAVESGAITRLLLTTPPRHGKSELVSRRFPAWYLGRHPRHQIIAASFGASLAYDFSRLARASYASAEHRRVFPDSALAGDSAAVQIWHTAHGGVYRAAGVGGAITGAGAHVVILDDPIKSREEADSEVYRDRTWEWWRNDVLSRLMPDERGVPGRVVVVMTRWHDDDLAGRLLEHEPERWTVRHWPALSDTGEALWPERYSDQYLEALRDTVGPRAWNSLWQGRPTPDTGTYFDRSWLVRGDPPPAAEMRYYGASDYAISESDGADYTVHLVVGVDTSDRMWVVDLYRERAHTGRWVNAAVDLMERWKPDGWAEERGAIIKSVGPWLVQTMNERGVHCVRHPLVSDADKSVRARSIQARMATRGLYIPRHALWSDTLERELLTFPAGRHDDIVDALGLIGRMLLVIRAQSAQASGRPRRYTIDDMIRDHERRRR